MKKILGLLALCALATSCVIESGTSSNRNGYKLRGICQELWDASGISAAVAMEQAFRIQDFIDSDEEGRKDSRFSDIGYFPSEGYYEIKDLGRIYTDGKAIDEDGAYWRSTVIGEGCLYIGYKGNGSWDVSYDYSEKDAYNSCYYGIYGLNPEGLEFTNTIRLLDTDQSGRHSWGSLINGVYKEDETYSAAFTTPSEIKFYWSTSSTSDSITTSLVADGKFHTEFFIAGYMKDFCDMMWSGGDCRYTTSMAEPLE